MNFKTKLKINYKNKFYNRIYIYVDETNSYK